MTIVVYTHCYKRPPPKKKAKLAAAAIAPAVVVHSPAAKPPAASKRKASAKAPVAPKTAPVATIVVGIGDKRMKRLRAERFFAQPHKPSPEIEAFFARNVRPGGPLAPARKR